jgi:predicted kinase
VFIGLQAAGKSSFFKQRFFDSHVRVSLDLLKTRHREQRMLDVCFATKQPLVVDNTNPTEVDRARYISQSRDNGFRVVGFYFRSLASDCLCRNAARSKRVPDVAILSTVKKLEIPKFSEGFDELNYVQLCVGEFRVEEWLDEI